MRAEAKSAANPNLIGLIRPELSTLQTIFTVVVGTLLLALAAKAKVPFYPVPMTLQTLAVAILAASLGARLAVATVLLYLFEGAVGLLVFTNTPPAAAGLGYFLGPTGGYLIGFVASAFIVGSLASQGWDRSLPRLFLAMMLGDLAIFAFGAGWLAYGATLASAPEGLGLAKALSVGVYPFLLGALVKEALGAATIVGIWSLARPNQPR